MTYHLPLGFTALQKCTAALRILAYGYSADNVDEYLRMAESTAVETLQRFVTAVVETFGGEYLREPTPTDIARHMRINEARGFPGMFGSLDCTHWDWKNCPVAWQGQYQDRDGNRSIIMEAFATQDLWIWHAFIGVLGSCNDINVFDCSTLMVKYVSNFKRVASFKVIAVYGVARAHEFLS